MLISCYDDVLVHSVYRVEVRSSAHMISFSRAACSSRTLEVRRIRSSPACNGFVARKFVTMMFLPGNTSTCTRAHVSRCSLFLPQVETIGGRLAVEATSAVGCGYDLSDIQRIPSGGRKYILVLPVGQGDMRCRGLCLSCQLHIRRSASYCSLDCKVRIINKEFLAGFFSLFLCYSSNCRCMG